MLLSSSTGFSLCTDLRCNPDLGSDFRWNSAYKDCRLLYDKRPDESAKSIVDFLVRIRERMGVKVLDEIGESRDIAAY